MSHTVLLSEQVHKMPLMHDSIWSQIYPCSTVEPALGNRTNKLSKFTDKTWQRKYQLYTSGDSNAMPSKMKVSARPCTPIPIGL